MRVCCRGSDKNTIIVLPNNEVIKFSFFSIIILLIYGKSPKALHLKATVNNYSNLLSRCQDIAVQLRLFCFSEIRL